MFVELSFVRVYHGKCCSSDLSFFAFSLQFCHSDGYEDILILLRDQWNLSNLEYADGFVLPSENPSKLYVFLDHLSNTVLMFGICFASP